MFLLIGNTLDLGREPPGLGSRVLDRPGVLFSRGPYSGPSFSLPSEVLPAPGASRGGGVTLRSVLPRDDPALALSGGNLSPFLMDPLPSPQGCNTRTQASQRTTTQDDEIHVQPQNLHTTLPLAWYQTTKRTHTYICVCVYTFSF